MCTLYERIAELCRSRGVSPSRMCLEVGISKSTMSDMKAGRTKGVTTDTAQRIADYFGVTVGYLLGNEDLETKKSPDESKLTEGEQMLLDLFRRIPKDQQPVVLNMIKAALSSIK